MEDESDESYESYQNNESRESHETRLGYYVFHRSAVQPASGAPWRRYPYCTRLRDVQLRGRQVEAVVSAQGSARHYLCVSSASGGVARCRDSRFAYSSLAKMT